MSGATPRRLRIAYYLRHAGNLHYFASLKPYLDHFEAEGRHDNRIVVQRPAASAVALPEHERYTQLFSDDADLAGYDLVLTPTYLREEDAPEAVRAVQVFHGMSDKPYTYERDFSGYALCLCAGQRQADRLRRHRHNRDVRIELVGYPKFESVPSARPPLADGRPTLIYCPTWRKGGLSSIERWLERPDVVAQLASRWNVIVKPHPNLFNPGREHYDAGIVERLRAQPGIKLLHCGNVMPWMARADLFLGDVSATGYEWLYFDRPMVFVNPQPGRLAASGDIDAPTRLWRCGDVCDELGELPALVERALAHDAHRAQREELLHYSVHRPRVAGATARAVAAVQAVLRELPPPRRVARPAVPAHAAASVI